LTCWRHRRK